MGEGADIFIINSAEQPVAFQSPEILENTGRIAALIEKAQVPDKAKAYTGEIADKDNLIVYVYSSRYKLYMFSVVPYTSLNRDVNWVKSLILAVTALLLVICLVLSLLTYFSVITPINAAVAVCRLFHITDPIAKGVSIGSAAHALGTAKAIELGEVEGAMSGLSIVVAGLLTVAGASVFANFM